MAIVPATTTTDIADEGPLRVMLVDDSVVIRGLVARWLGEERDIKVVATAGNGAIAVREVAQANPEIVVLDIEMPEMDGITALPEILRRAPGARVLMSSTLTQAGAEVTMKALTLGASDYLTKPSSTREAGAADAFRAELVGKIRALGQALRRRRRPAAAPVGPAATATATATARVAGVAPLRAVAAAKPTGARPASRLPPKVIAIGSSTGGPQALTNLLRNLAGRLDQPILITQHMPATFTAILAQHLEKATGVTTAEARDGEVLRGGRIFVAPGNHHMVVEVQGARMVLRLNQEPPENFCRPSVDPMLRSVVAAYGGAVLGVILTGMGHDGLAGSRALVEAGGTLIAQDEASSVVWGMPGAVANAGLCHAVLPLDDMPGAIERLARSPLKAGERA